MKLLLDTHAAFWLVAASAKLGKAAQRRLKNAEASTVAISDISLFELAALERRKRIAFDRDFLQQLASRLVVLPIDAEIALIAAAVALPQGDPFDRIIVATALHHELVLVTKDLHIAESGLVEVIW